MFGDDETYYTCVAKEIDSDQDRPGLRAKALAETDYEERRARARYLKLRVKVTKAEVSCRRHVN
ncbi:MAG: hypothetical protein ACREXW_00725 [Gammaproteobacteria bacterium]